MVDHQFSVYEPILRVPLVVRYPGHFPPGRDDRPVALHDLFPTLLKLAGTTLPAGWSSDAVSLLTPPAQRRRLAEYPAPFELAFDYVERARPGFDRAPWQRALRAYYDGRHKLIWGSDGRHELYDLFADPQESRSLFAEQTELAGRLTADLQTWVGALKRPVTTRPLPELSPEQRRRLSALGYAEEPAEDEPDNDDPP
jgi:arylsulfatase A-like enzyme